MPTRGVAELDDEEVEEVEELDPADGDAGGAGGIDVGGLPDIAPHILSIISSFA